MKIDKLVAKQRKFFAEGKTLSISFRKKALDSLKAAIKKYESEINDAVFADLNKSPMETFMCETGLSLAELAYVRKHFASWAKNTRVHTGLANFHAKSFTVQEPYGVTLIMSPWNYPFMLTIEPLIGAIAAGNCCIVKPSAYSPATSKVLHKIISETFDEEYVAVVEGGRAENAALLDQKFDYIFFTGSVAVGREVMRKASVNLTPVTLELGGKSPCIVDSTANLKVAAARIVFGKFLNLGQTCVAPDYLLVDKRIKDQLLELIKQEIVKQFGERPIENNDYGKIINQKHFDRLMKLIDKKKLVFGGEADKASLKIAPTILDKVTAKDPVMLEEIFGPILPVITFTAIEEAEEFILQRPKPLALYLFTKSRKTEKHILSALPFGGGCVNDTIVHLATSAMGFGGVGDSGMGSYHGQKSFQTFSHEKSVLKKYNWIDMPVRYQPYTPIKMKLLKLFLR